MCARRRGLCRSRALPNSRYFKYCRRQTPRLISNLSSSRKPHAGRTSCACRVTTRSVTRRSFRFSVGVRCRLRLSTSRLRRRRRKRHRPSPAAAVAVVTSQWKATRSRQRATSCCRWSWSPSARSRAARRPPVATCGTSAVCRPNSSWYSRTARPSAPSTEFEAAFYAASRSAAVSRANRQHLEPPRRGIGLPIELLRSPVKSCLLRY